MRYLLFFLLYAAPSFAASIPDSVLIVGQPSADQSREIPSAAIPPDPAKLTANWWRYFEVDSATLKSRIDAASSYLNAVGNLPPLAGTGHATVLITRFLGNLRSLLEARASLAPPPPISRPAQDRYGLEQWLQLVHKRRTTQAELQAAHEDVQRKEKRFSAARQRLDSMTSVYLALPPKSPERPVRGLEIMAEWSDSAVAGERLRLQRAALEAHRAQELQLDAESAAARNRLTADAGDIQRLEREIEAAERGFAAAQKEASELASAPVPGHLETEGDKIRTLLFEQKLRYSTIKEATADATLTGKFVQSDLARWLAETAGTSPAELRIRLSARSEHIAKIADRIELWRDEAERDQGRAGKALAALFASASHKRGDLMALAQQRLSIAQDTLLSLQRLDGEIHDALLLIDTLDDRIAAREGGLRTGMDAVKSSLIRLWVLVRDSMQTSLFRIGETPVTAFGILRVVIIVTVAWLLSHSVRRGLTHLSARQRGSSAFLYTCGRLLHYLIVIIGISIGLSSIGVDLSNFALIAGALSLGMGFGLQAIVSNFVSGLIVLFERSLRVGDFVELSSGVAGEVRAVNVRSTLVTTPDMVDILVPNSEFVNGKVINWTLTDASRRVHIPFGVAYGTDKKLVQIAALEAAAQTSYTIKDRKGREPQVWLTNFGDSSLDFELVVWVLPGAVKKPQMVRAAYYWELETAFRKYGIQIPFPQRDIHLRNDAEQVLISSPDDNQNPPIGQAEQSAVR